MKDVDATQAVARQDLCRFLAACYYQPGPEFSEEKLFGSMLAAAAAMDPGLEASARRLGEAFIREGERDLLLDYTRLFLGPVGARAKPYGSVWLERDGALMEGSTLDVLDLYREGGFEIADDFRDLPDHVAVELEFLYVLNFRASQATQSGDAAALEALAAVRRRFLERHLAKWLPPFAAAVAAGAESDFYRELAAMTRRFVQLESALS